MAGDSAEERQESRNRRHRRLFAGLLVVLVVADSGSVSHLLFEEHAFLARSLSMFLCFIGLTETLEEHTVNAVFLIEDRVGIESIEL